MSKIFEWIKSHLIIVGLVLLVVFLLLKDSFVGVGGVNRYNSYGGSDLSLGALSDTVSSPMMVKSIGIPGRVQPAPAQQENRMVVQDTNLSMLVKDVADVLKGIQTQVEAEGGYLVNKNISKPEGAASGAITVRVPTEKRESVLDGIRKLGVKVVQENVTGYDVTDQYVDIDGRIASLEKTKTKIEAIMDQATRVSDLMDIQMQLTNIQQQIDSYKGQQNYLEQTAKLTSISVVLSTDELALPYAPDKAWRPEVVFKLAVRSLVGTLRGFGSAAIWIIVYLPVWGIILLGYIFVKKIVVRKTT